jgi:hypothetical protein
MSILLSEAVPMHCPIENVIGIKSIQKVVFFLNGEDLTLFEGTVTLKTNVKINFTPRPITGIPRYYVPVGAPTS